MLNSKDSYFNSYESIKEEIKFLINSEIRLKILNCLSHKPFSMSDIHKSTGLSYSSISNNIHKLEEKEYVTRKSGKYHLKNLVKVILNDIIHFNKATDVINNYSNFWTDHNIGFIDTIHLKEISSLKGAKIIESDSTDIYKTHNAYKEFLNEANDVRSIIPFFHPDYNSIFEELIKRDTNIELLLSKTIATTFIKSMNSKILKYGINNEIFRFKSLDDTIKISLTVTDDSMSLGLFKIDGNYDQNRILISDKKSAVEWGNKLFNEYESKGKKLYYAV